MFRSVSFGASCVAAIAGRASGQRLDTAAALIAGPSRNAEVRLVVGHVELSAPADSAPDSHRSPPSGP